MPNSNGLSNDSEDQVEEQNSLNEDPCKGVKGTASSNKSKRACKTALKSKATLASGSQTSMSDMRAGLKFLNELTSVYE